MNQKKVLSTLSEYKIDYLEEFKKRNSGLTISPERLYKVVESTMQNLRDPISLEDFLSFYNNDHITEIILPEEPTHLAEKPIIHEPIIETQPDIVIQRKNSEDFKAQLTFPTVLKPDEKASQYNLKYPDKDVQADPESRKFKDMFPYFIPALISSGISLVVKEIYRSDELHVEYLFLVLGAIITVWFLYLFPAIIGGIIKLVTGNWNKKVYRILVIIQICGLWLRSLLKSINF